MPLPNEQSRCEGENNIKLNIFLDVSQSHIIFWAQLNSADVALQYVKLNAV